MKSLSAKASTFAVHAVVVALYAMPDTAAALPILGRMLHRTPKVNAAERVTVAFHNASLQTRELRVGEERFAVDAMGDVRLKVTVGADVRVYSPVNSHVEGLVLKVTPRSGEQVVVLR